VKNEWVDTGEFDIATTVAAMASPEYAVTA
jgi:hypothetical protein